MTSQTSQENLLAAAARACQKPVFVAIVARAQSPKKAADLAERNAERLGLSKQDIQDVRWLAILKRDAEALFGPGMDFLAALQHVSQDTTPQRSTEMKVVWGTGHYQESMVQWLQRILESCDPQTFGAYMVNHCTLGVYKLSERSIPPYVRVEIKPLVQEDALVSHNGRLQPVKIIVPRPYLLHVAKVLATRWQRRIPKDQRTKESVVIERMY